MKVLVIGATGYIGSAATQALERAGHQVVPFLRVGEVTPSRIASADFRVGDLTDASSLRRAAQSVDAIVHAGAPLGDWDADRDAVLALLEGLRDAGSSRLVYLSGTWVLGATTRDQVADETSPPRPIAIVHGRENVESVVRAHGGIVVRAGVVHGRGSGIPGLLVHWARETGTARYVVGEDPSPVWSVVHVDDLAELLALALTDARPGELLHGVGEPAVPVSDIARAADEAAGGPGQATSWPIADAVGDLGPAFAGALALSQVVTARRAAQLGWRPSRPTISEELRTGSYASA
ncbi:NAD-dependent epimerase/dehydratase family protein [Nocardioides bigeumensis]|uniref:NAD-dependent epimerase/dehydratase family protein n=1 Tax=Nocardioides bigeumensis TaxID=433657 RepID=A0ABP5JF18_9ACTN